MCQIRVLRLGIGITVASIFAGALNMVMASVIKLNPFETQDV